ncbi:Cloroperoxidase [Apiospora marii]|uniref:Cloroperoxidase n=1 Tax=Apiospora marii TaxID=335849 RepID=A0ABR1R5M9_9PEZI
MLNSLANHAYLPHDGKNIDVTITKKALADALNIDEELGQFLFDNAITTNPVPNATAYSLKDLSNHNVLEHDASFSRQDAYFGPQDIFNRTIFAETQSYWHGPIINVTMAAAARQARIRTSNATNPQFSLSDLGSGFSLGEAAAYLIILGDRGSHTARRNVVEYLFGESPLLCPLPKSECGARLATKYCLLTFEGDGCDPPLLENEKLPTELGWQRPQPVVTFDELRDVLDRIYNETDPDIRTLARRGMHG